MVQALTGQKYELLPLYILNGMYVVLINRNKNLGLKSYLCYLIILI